MKKEVEIVIQPWKNNPEDIKKIIASTMRISMADISFVDITKRSLDARKGKPKFRVRADVYIQEEPPKKVLTPSFHHVKDKESVIIVGAGPAGLFAGLKALELGLKPFILERGKNVRDRRRDLAQLNKELIVNQESNYCFGEGGAGTYSDGKLYTRSKKRGDVQEILSLLVAFGAEESILYDAHPHIGTNKLPQIIVAIREKIMEQGGEVHFESKVTDFIIEENKMKGVVVNGSQTINSEHVILATGHSARDIFELLHQKNILIEFKPFALGVRVEHPQNFIDANQYHCDINEGRGEFLPPSSYSLVTQTKTRGVFSFCMCPGGIIAPCATAQEEVVTNGWSPSKRNNPYANSGIVVEVKEDDLRDFEQYGPLKGLAFQKSVEKKCWEAGGKTQVVPAQRLVDFVRNKESKDLPETSYIPGIKSVNLNKILPPFVSKSLQQAFIDFDKKMRGYLTNQAVVHAPESRTSSPVRIPRDKISLEHPQIQGFYPCGEGAGYAGGIVSAAIDGQKCMVKIAEKLSHG